jgi:hypothetical protein
MSELPPWYGLTHPGEVRSVRDAMAIPAVSACVQLLAGTIARAPAATVDDAGGNPDDPPLFLVDATRTVMLLITDYLLCGNGIVEPVGAGWPPPRIDVLPAELCNAEGGPYALDPDRVRYGGRALDLRTREALIVRRGRHPNVTWRGWGVIEQHTGELGEVAQTGSYLSDSTTEAAVPSIAVITPDPYLGQGSVDEARARWDALFGGRRRPGIFPKGTEVHTLSWSPTDASLAELRQLDVADVARMFGLPPEMIGGPTGGGLQYANLESSETRTLRTAVEPIMQVVEDALSDLLPPGRRVRFDRAALSRGTLAESAEAIDVLVRAGVPVEHAMTLAGLPQPPGGWPEPEPVPPPLADPAADPAAVDDPAEVPDDAAVA